MATQSHDLRALGVGFMGVGAHMLKIVSRADVAAGDVFRPALEQLRASSAALA